jgi:hypothetical protein
MLRDGRVTLLTGCFRGVLETKWGKVFTGYWGKEGSMRCTVNRLLGGRGGVR